MYQIRDFISDLAREGFSAVTLKESDDRTLIEITLNLLTLNVSITQESVCVIMVSGGDNVVFNSIPYLPFRALLEFYDLESFYTFLVGICGKSSMSDEPSDSLSEDFRELEERLKLTVDND